MKYSIKVLCTNCYGLEKHDYMVIYKYRWLVRAMATDDGGLNDYCGLEKHDYTSGNGCL